MGSVSINGKTYFGNNISIVNNKVMIDGKLAEESSGPELTILITGDPVSIRADGPVRVTGDVKVDVNGSQVDIGGDVGGSVNGANVNCGDVGGSINAAVVNRR